MKASLLSTLTFAGIVLASTGLYAQTSTWKIDPNHSGVNFQVRHMAVSTVRGSIDGLNGIVKLDDKDITKSSIDATTEVANVFTGVEQRDKHLKSPDFFNVEKYPKISFKSSSISRSGGKLQLIGDLTLAGVTKSVSLDLDGPSAPQTDAKGVTRSGFSATGILSRKEFDFGQKTPASAAIGDEIKFTIDIEIDKQ